MITVLVKFTLISVISGCTLPDWNVDNKDNMYAGKWYFYKQRVAESYQEAIDRCLCGEFIKDAVNPLKWTIVFGYSNKSTGKIEEVILNGSSKKENSGLYSYEPPVEISESIVCGDVDGVRIFGAIGHSSPCLENDLSVWIGFVNRHNSSHPLTIEEQKKLDQCLKRNKIDPETLTLIDNENCTN